MLPLECAGNRRLGDAFATVAATSTFHMTCREYTCTLPPRVREERLYYTGRA